MGNRKGSAMEACAASSTSKISAGRIKLVQMIRRLIQAGQASRKIMRFCSDCSTVTTWNEIIMLKRILFHRRPINDAK